MLVRLVRARRGNMCPVPAVARPGGRAVQAPHRVGGPARSFRTAPAHRLAPGVAPGSAATDRSGQSKGELLGQTRPATVRQHPDRTGQPAQRPQAWRQRGHHPGARSRRARGRGALPARPGVAVRAHQVPGRRAAGPRGARPHQGRHRAHRGQARRPAQAARRRGHDPGQDRRQRHLAALPARRGRHRLRLRQGAAPRDDRGRRHGAGGGRGAGARRGRPAGRSRAPHRAAARWSSGSCPTRS